MPASLIIAAPAGPTRQRLERFFGPRGWRVVSLAREQIVARGQLVLDDLAVLLDGEEILDGTHAALIVDSGYMWPLPTLAPTPKQWAEHQGHFDEYLRDERETASLWYSLMEIINDRVEVCVNPQAAFEHEALKPFAFELLREAGVPLPALLTTNDPDALSSFCGQHPGGLLARELLPDAPARWLEKESPTELGLDRSPLLVQALSSREKVEVMAVNGQAVVCRPQPSEEATLAVVPVVQQVLQMPWATLVFRRDTGGEVLSDFSASPDLGALPPSDAERVLEALAQVVDVEGSSG